jgi:hypothetical protein
MIRLGIILLFCLQCLALRAETSSGDAPVDQLYWSFLDKATDFLSTRLRWPDAIESERILNSVRGSMLRHMDEENEDEDVSETADELGEMSVESLLRHTENGVMVDFQKGFPDRFIKMRRRLATAYSRAIAQSDLPPRYRTTPMPPSEQLYFLSTIMPKANGGPKLMIDYLKGVYSSENLLDIYVPGRPAPGLFPQPLIFPEGQDQLLRAARLETPSRFRGFVDTRIVNLQRAADTLKAVEKAKGFVAVSWTSGKEVNQDFFDTLLKMLEERDWILLVGPTQQNFEGLPEIFLKHPRIHVVTHTIENRYLKISNIPINPNIENALGAAKKPGMYKPGQTVIVFHPHQMMETVATTTNEYLPVQLWSTGSITNPLGVFTSASSGTRMTTGKNFHKLKALVVEKGDGVSAYDSDGLQNIWHVRPISFYDDRQWDGTAGFIDLSRSYQVHYAADGLREIKVINEDPQYAYLGDPHDRVTDPAFVDSLVKDLGLVASTRVTFVAGDAFDGASINHWLFNNLVAMNSKIQTGSANVLEEVNRLIITINALLQRYPNARFAQIVGNHDEWLSRLLENPPDLQEVINGDFIAELSFAVKTLKIPLWDYIFKRRQGVMSALLEAFPEKRRDILSRVMPIFDADRVDIIGRGQALYAGPPHRKVALQFHGDKSSGPKSASFTSHARAMPEGGGVTGHTHKLQMYDEVIDVGAMAPPVQSYTVGQYSNQGQGLAVIYPNGTKQLVVFNRLAGTMVQRYPAKVLSTEAFFGEDPMHMVVDDNSQVDKASGEAAIFAELNRLRSSLGVCEAELTVH